MCARARARARARRAPSSHLSGVRFSLCALQESARAAAREFRACARPSHRHCATRGGMLAAIPPFSGDAISIPACTRRSATGRWFVCEQVGVRGRLARARDGRTDGCSRKWDDGRSLWRTARRRAEASPFRVRAPLASVRAPGARSQLKWGPVPGHLFIVHHHAARALRTGPRRCGRRHGASHERWQRIKRSINGQILSSYPSSAAVAFGASWSLLPGAERRRTWAGLGPRPQACA